MAGIENYSLIRLLAERRLIPSECHTQKITLTPPLIWMGVRTWRKYLSIDTKQDLPFNSLAFHGQDVETIIVKQIWVWLCVLNGLCAYL